MQSIAKSADIDAWSVDHYRQETRSNKAIVFVATIDKVIVGFVLGGIVPGNVAGADGEIYNIAVADGSRRKGIGQMLLAEAVEVFNSNECHSVWLEARSSNRKAIQFYENNGFRRCSTRRNFYSNPVEDALIMRLQLIGDVGS
jgi:ribosomal-protein-alanine N-acetyltransferase